MKYLLLFFISAGAFAHGVNFLDHIDVIHKCGAQGVPGSFRVVSPYDLCIAPETAWHTNVPHTAPKPSPAPIPPETALNYYVSTTGSDSRTITEAQNKLTPWATLQKAADNVSKPGSIVHVAEGTYSQIVTLSKSGTESARITFVSDVKHGAKIQGASNEAIIRIDGKYIDFKNFDIKASGKVEEAILITNSNNRVIGNKVHDVGGTGISTWNSVYTMSHVDIIGNIIFNIGGTDHMQHGIYAGSNQDSLIQNNVVYNVAGFGIHCWHNPKGLTISNNLMFSNGDGGITVGAGDAPYTGKAENFIVSNNISINNGTYGIQEHGSVGANQYLNNLVFNNPTNWELLNGNTAQASINADPKLVNLVGGDYHLLSTSPAINAGTTTGAPLVDMAGNARIGLPEIGVFEY